MSTRLQLEIVALIALSCGLVGVTIGWTWYLQAVFWAALLGFCAMSGLFWLDRKNDRIAHVRRSPRHFIVQEGAYRQPCPSQR